MLSLRDDFPGRFFFFAEARAGGGTRHKGNGGVGKDLVQDLPIDAALGVGALHVCGKTSLKNSPAECVVLRVMQQRIVVNQAVFVLGFW